MLFYLKLQASSTFSPPANFSPLQSDFYFHDSRESVFCKATSAIISTISNYPLSTWLPLWYLDVMAMNVNMGDHGLLFPSL